MNFLTRFSDFVREFEFPSFEREFNEIESAFKMQFDKVKEKFKNLTNNHTVEVPFDKAKGQKLSSVTLGDNRLTVEITSYDANTHVNGRAMTSITIPEEVDTTSMRQINDEENKRIINAETCTEDGNAAVPCKRCSTTNEIVLPATGHEKGDPVEENRKAPTCTVAGSYERVVYCATCSTQMSRETIPVPANEIFIIPFSIS